MLIDLIMILIQKLVVIQLRMRITKVLEALKIISEEIIMRM